MESWLANLLGKAPAAGPTDTIETNDEAPAQAVRLDQWGVRRGAELLAESPPLQQLLGGSKEATADLYGMCFEPEPTLEESCRDADRLEYLRRLEKQADYQALHDSTMCDELTSGIATVHLAQGLHALKREREQAGRQPPARSKAEQEARDARAAVAAGRHVARSLQAARREVQAAEEAASAFGRGPGDGGSTDKEAIGRIYQKLSRSPRLRQILDLAGRYRRLARAKQATKADHGADDVVGVIPDGEIGRLVASELVALADEDLELDAMRRLVERQALCREMKAAEKQAKGPIMVLVDCSSSMGGDPIAHAKALGLTLAWVARHQKRWCCLIDFADSPTHRPLALPPGAWDDAAVMRWLEDFQGGGTDIPLRPDQLEGFFGATKAPRGKTDLVVITDGQWSADADYVARTKGWLAANKARVISLRIGTQADSLAAISDEVHLLGALSPEAAGVSSAVSI